MTESWRRFPLPPVAEDSKAEQMNRYHIYDEKNPTEILYTAFALDNDHAYTLAQVAGFDLKGLTIDFVSRDPRDPEGNLYLPDIRKGLAP